VPDKVRAVWNGMLKGEKLPPHIRAQFRDESGRVFGAQRQRYEAVAGEYKRLATQQGFSPSDVVLDTGLGAGGGAAGSASPKRIKVNANGDPIP
jgi:hypothetical protein